MGSPNPHQNDGAAVTSTSQNDGAGTAGTSTSALSMQGPLPVPKLSQRRNFEQNNEEFVDLGILNRVSAL